MEFFKNYKSAAEGLDRLKVDISSCFTTSSSKSDEKTEMIITENLEEEMKKLRQKH